MWGAFRKYPIYRLVLRCAPSSEGFFYTQNRLTNFSHLITQYICIK